MRFAENHLKDFLQLTNKVWFIKNSARLTRKTFTQEDYISPNIIVKNKLCKSKRGS